MSTTMDDLSQGDENLCLSLVWISFFSTKSPMLRYLWTTFLFVVSLQGFEGPREATVGGGG
jgi:hypothetical protein